MDKGYLILTVLSVISLFSGYMISSSSVDHQTANKHSGPNVVLITVESTPAGHVGPCYGYERNTFSEICEVAEDGVLFEKAYSQSVITFQVIPSLLASRPPNSVGWSPDGENRFEINPEARLIQEVLKERGYSTEGYSYSISEKGFDRGIDDVYRSDEVEDIELNSTNQFIWHFPGYPHKPYAPRKKYRNWSNTSTPVEELEEEYSSKNYSSLTPGEAMNLYDDELLWADSEVGRLIDRLKSKGVYNDSLIIITADHGEKFSDNVSRMGHSGPPSDSVNHVPLIVKFPDNRYSGRRVSSPVRHIDLAPTIYDVLGIEGEETTGKSLIPLINGEKDNRTIFSSSQVPSRNWAIWSDSYYYRILNTNETCIEGREPFETLKVEADSFSANSTPSEESLRGELCDIYREGFNNRMRPKQSNSTAEHRRMLQTLGYIE